MIFGGIKGIKEERVLRGISGSCTVGVAAGRILIPRGDSAPVCDGRAILCFFEQIEQSRLKSFVYPLSPAGVILSARSVSGESVSLLAALRVPYLIIKEGFPRSFEGAVALLDTENDTLVIDPDIDRLDAWRAGALVQREAERFSVFQREDGGGIEVSISECLYAEELYERLCELAERYCAQSVTLSLRAPYSESERGEFLEYCSAFLRAAVYGKFCLQIEGYRSRDDVRAAFELLERAACRLEEEGRESNPDVSRGVLIDTPVWLMGSSFGGYDDFRCIDIDAVCAHILGRDRIDTDALGHFFEPLTLFFESYLCASAFERPIRVRSRVLRGTDALYKWSKKAGIREIYLG